MYMNIILSATGMEDSNVDYTPFDKEPLCKDINGDLCCEDYSHCSVISMMLYLSVSTYSYMSWCASIRSLLSCTQESP